ncbi:MAG: hypothetical protein AAGJ87_13200 [Pseudomonadota bacterium]
MTTAQTGAPIDPSHRVKALIALTQELTDIFLQENTALKERRPAAIAPLQADKARLAAAYAKSIRQIAEDRSLVSDAGDALLDELREITRIFEDGAREQRALLSAAQTAGERVMQAVADEAAAQNAAPGYGAPEKAAGAAPLAIDERA